ncbi:MAG: hypothetical protein U9Q96_02080 [Patescibacteria group bacterium]|nr:hypothetical protein [Patescibacteria group bacterium]
MVDWTSITMFRLEEFWGGFLGFVPKLIWAFIIFVVGWMIASGIGRLIEEILKRVQLDKLFQSKKWSQSLEKADFESKPSEFIGSICRWILLIVVLSITAEILLPAGSNFGEFLSDVVAWLPNLLAAILIFVATVIISSFAEKLVKAGVHGAKVGYSKFAGTITRWAIWIFGISAILIQLGIADELVLILLQGIVAMMAIAGGLAFGLGGKDVAADFWEGMKEKIKK